MEAEAREVGCGAERDFVVRRAVTLGCVLDHHEAVFTCYGAKRIHLTADTGIVDRRHNARPRRYGVLGQRLVEIQRVGANVNEDEPRAAQSDRIRERWKGERGHDDFVTRPDVREQHRHLERSRAGMREKHSAGPELVLEELSAPTREWPVAREVRVRGSLDGCSRTRLRSHTVG